MAFGENDEVMVEAHVLIQALAASIRELSFRCMQMTTVLIEAVIFSNH